MKSQILLNEECSVQDRNISELTFKGMVRLVNFFILIILTIVSNNLFGQSKITDQSFDNKVRQTLKKNAETLRFMENKGQVSDKDVLYYFEGRYGSAFIERNRIRFVANDDTLITSLQKNGTAKTERKRKATHTFTLTMLHSNPNPDFQLGNSFKTKYNFFLGNDVKDAVTGVKAAKDLTINDIYPGIDLRLYSSADALLEFDWILAPGADFRKVKLNFHGQDNLSIDDKGNLIVRLRFSDV